MAGNDRMINPDLERTLAKKMKATTTTLASSQVAMLAQPTQVAAVIMDATAKLVAAK